MLWIVFKFIMKLALVVAPLAFVPYITRHCHDSALLTSMFGQAPEKATIEKFVGAIVASLSISGMTVYESFTHLRPRAQAKRFCVAYVEKMITNFAGIVSENGLTLIQDVRINVTFSRRCLFFPFISHFEWFANRGFGGGHHDNKMWLFTFQGLCGRAFKKRQLLALDLRNGQIQGGWPSPANFWLFPWQIRKSAHLKAVVSIPLFKEIKMDAMTEHETVGVINVDAVSDRGATWLLANSQELEKFCENKGTALVWLSCR